MLITLSHKVKKAVCVASHKDHKAIRIINSTLEDIPT